MSVIDTFKVCHDYFDFDLSNITIESEDIMACLDRQAYTWLDRCSLVKI